MYAQDFLDNIRGEVSVTTSDIDSKVFISDGLSGYFSRCGRKIAASISNRCDSIVSFSAIADDSGLLQFKNDADAFAATEALEILRAARPILRKH